MSRQWLLVVVAVSAVFAAPNNGPPAKRLLLFSIDGFRYDLLNATMVPTLHDWAKQNVRFVNGLNSQQLTFTSSNHQSIVTGLWTESHGITANFFYDTGTNQFYDVWNKSRLPGVVERSMKPEWYGGEPIWETNWRAGGQSSIFYWPLGDPSFAEKKQRVLFKLWNGNMGRFETWRPEVDELVERMTVAEAEGRPNLYAWYIAEPDHTLHVHGFYDGFFRRKIAEIDAIFKYLLWKMEERGLLDTTDLIVTSDHGHTEIYRDKVFCYENVISGKPGVDYWYGSNQLFPKSHAQAVEMYRNLTEAIRARGLPIKVHWRRDIAGIWHLNHPTRVGAIIFEPAIGADAISICDAYDMVGPFHHSTHGHNANEKEMRGLLAMGGPSFRKELEIDSIPENIDLYPLMAHLLGVEPAPNNGTIQRLAVALRSRE